MQKLGSEDGMPWGGVIAALKNHLPESLDDRDQFAYNLVATALNNIFGPQGQAWESYRHPQSGKMWVREKN